MQKPTERSEKEEADILGGTFHSDPFRLVDVADASRTEGSPESDRFCGRSA
jgi:hypothetical protein